jgi:transposase
MSMIGAIAYRADGAESKLFVRLIPATVRSGHFVTFLAHLSRHLRGPIIVIWDRLNGHRAKDVRRWVDRHPRCQLHFLPAYAPELNPVEALWAWLKGTRLANACRENLAQLAPAIRHGVRSARRRCGLLNSFLRRSGLSL